MQPGLRPFPESHVKPRSPNVFLTIDFRSFRTMHTSPMRRVGGNG
jgi:hypothetical protein